MHELPIDQKKLKDLVKKCKHYNIFAIFLPNYYGERDHPVSKLLTQLVKECVEYLSAMSEEEINSLIASLPPSVRMMIDQSGTYGENVSTQRVAIYYLVAEVNRKYKQIVRAWERDLNESEVLKTYPELGERLDDEGLMQIDDGLELLEGGILYRDHVLHYHQFLRRGFTSNMNFDFTSRFIMYYQKTMKKNSFRIAIDHRRIMPKEFYERIIEFDKWFGPTFDATKIDDPNAVGLTVLKRNKNSLFELTNNLDRTEFFWSFRDGVKTLQIEEVSDIDYKFDGYNINRYVHSERETRQQIFRHLDGAAKVYLENNYEGRFASKIPNEAKCHAKPKLFRIDGSIGIRDWIELISFFYKSNEMIIEYFNPGEFERRFELRIRDPKAWKEAGGTINESRRDDRSRD